LNIELSIRKRGRRTEDKQVHTSRVTRQKSKGKREKSLEIKNCWFVWKGYNYFTAKGAENPPRGEVSTKADAEGIDIKYK